MKRVRGRWCIGIHSSYNYCVISYPGGSKGFCSKNGKRISREKFDKQQNHKPSGRQE